MANGNQDQITHFIQSKLFAEFPVYNKLLRISHYATASTDSAAYIIGGFNQNYDIVSTIAEYKNNNWREIGYLNEPKYALSAIFNNGEYIVVGGNVNFGR